MKYLFIFIIFYNFLFADSFDTIQKNISLAIKYFSFKTDLYLSNQEYKQHKDKTKQNLNSFFLNSDYYDNYSKSYMIYTYGYSYGEYEKLQNVHNLKLKIDLPHTKRRLRLIIDGNYDDNIKSITDSDNTVLALEYMLPFLDSSVRGGLKGLSDPFIRIRIGVENDFKVLIFEPIQYLEYSSKTEFKETTKFYFDKKIDQTSLLEILLQRSTQTHIRGTDLFAGVFYNIKYAKNRGIVYEISTSAQTKPEDSLKKIIKYTLKATWREQILKKYTFINISPFIEFHRKYDYHSQLFLMVTFDIKF